MGKLSDILCADGGGSIFDNWDSVQAADDFKPLPAGCYECRLVSGELRKARTGTLEYVLTFRVIQGEHKGRQVWYSIYLTEAAKGMAKRDFNKLGITNPQEQLMGPLPKGFRCKVQVSLRKDDAGVEQNRVRTFDLIGIDLPDVDPFAPSAASPPDEAAATFAADEARANAAEAEEGDVSFSPAKF